MHISQKPGTLPYFCCELCSLKISVRLLHFYRAKRSVARYCHDELSVRLSVRLSVTLVDCDHTRSNSAKIISRLISLGTWPSADTNITDLLKREHP